jgi:Uroporphyrinogen decarboxylase (URO-D)
MNTRERFNNVLHWQKPDRIPIMDFGYWGETILEWHKQGLPHDIQTGKQLEQHLGLEGTENIAYVPVRNGLFPSFEREVLEEQGNKLLIRDDEGNTCRVLKDREGMSQYVSYGLETREDWEVYKRERLDCTLPQRIGDVQKAVAEAHDAGMPVLFNAGSLYGYLRNWMGLENFSIALMTEIEWVEEMMEHLTQMTLYLIEKALPGADIDVAWWWEDMCFNKGPLLSPKLFEELMVPRYQRITDALKKQGIDVNVLDCDGNIHELVPGWLRGGINCMFPLESLHTDVLELRKQYGHDLLLFGGVNKIPLAKGREAIDKELQRLRPLVEEGGYIPTVDHRVPPDVSYENYLYYIEKKREMFGG